MLGPSLITTVVIAGLLSVSQVSAATENYTKFQLATSLERKQEAIKATGSNRMSSISSLFSSIREKLIGKGTIIDPLPSNEYLSVHCQDPVEEAHQQSHDAPLVYSSARVVEQAPVRAQVVSYTGHLSQNTGQVTYHTVQPGESLSSISRQYYGNSSDWKILAQENGIQNSSSISVGTRLYIPHDPKNPSKDKLETLPITANAPVHYLNRYTAPSEQPLDYNNYEWKVYQAKSGDTLDSLAERFLGDGSKSSVLAQYNKLPVNTALPANYTLLVPQEKRTAITERYILSTQGVFR